VFDGLKALPGVDSTVEYARVAYDHLIAADPTVLYEGFSEGVGSFQHIIDELCEVMKQIMPSATSALKRLDFKNIPKTFCERLLALVSTLSATFPEVVAMQSAKEYLETVVLGCPEAEKYVLEMWHYVMTVATFVDGQRQLRQPPLYDHVARRDVIVILDAPDLIDLMSKFDIHRMYFDDSITEQDLESVFQHLDTINATAQIYVSIPPDMYTALLEIYSDVEETHGGISPERLAALIQRVIAGNMERFMGGDMDAVTRLTQWTQHISRSPLLTNFNARHISMLTELLPKFAEVAKSNTALPSEVSSLIVGLTESVPALLRGVSGDADDGGYSSTVGGEAGEGAAGTRAGAGAAF
jgi:hypothetical protein